MDYFTLGSITLSTGENIIINKTLTDFCLPNSHNTEVNPYVLARNHNSVLDLIKKTLHLNEAIESFSVLVTPRSIEHCKISEVELNAYHDNLTFYRDGTFFTDSSYRLTFQYLVKHYLTQTLNS